MLDSPYDASLQQQRYIREVIFKRRWELEEVTRRYWRSWNRLKVRDAKCRMGGIARKKRKYTPEEMDEILHSADVVSLFGSRTACPIAWGPVFVIHIFSGRYIWSIRPSRFSQPSPVSAWTNGSQIASKMHSSSTPRFIRSSENSGSSSSSAVTSLFGDGDEEDNEEEYLDAESPEFLGAFSYVDCGGLGRGRRRADRGRHTCQSSPYFNLNRVELAWFAGWFKHERHGSS
ncbi:hypothetical protein C8J57DRAFT_1616569 [Mycena rebaudengoi]|nr:hypothetical protein C8J57DRAFT_1616569 [Mycena rebaudengoi]